LLEIRVGQTHRGIAQVLYCIFVLLVANIVDRTQQMKQIARSN